MVIFLGNLHFKWNQLLRVDVLAAFGCLRVSRLGRGGRLDPGFHLSPLHPNYRRLQNHHPVRHQGKGKETTTHQPKRNEMVTHHTLQYVCDCFGAIVLQFLTINFVSAISTFAGAEPETASIPATRHENGNRQAPANSCRLR